MNLLPPDPAAHDPEPDGTAPAQSASADPVASGAAADPDAAPSRPTLPPLPRTSPLAYVRAFTNARRGREGELRTGTDD